MKAFWQKFLDFYIYSSLHISLAVAALVYWSYALFDLQPDRWYISFCFFATLGMYTAHRLIGVRRIPPKLLIKRFEKVRYKTLQLWFYGFLAFCGTVWSFYFLNSGQQKLLIIPVILSLCYAVPILFSKRLRDLPFIKIFVIALVWTWVSLWLPMMESHLSATAILLWACERFFFIFAITLPFDIRDLKIDAATQVKTIPRTIGIKKTRLLSVTLLLLSCSINLFFYFTGILNLPLLCASFLSYLLIAVLIWNVKQSQTDYYYAGLLDGTMLSHALILIIVKCLNN